MVDLIRTTIKSTLARIVNRVVAAERGALDLGLKLGVRVSICLLLRQWLTMTLLLIQELISHSHGSKHVVLLGSLQF